jgi:hypothetical protein
MTRLLFKINVRHGKIDSFLKSRIKACINNGGGISRDRDMDGMINYLISFRLKFTHIMNKLHQ